MPSRNTIRLDVADAYYHVYSRGINKQTVFRHPQDKNYFLYLLSRHLSINEVATKNNSYTYAHLRGKVAVLTYCIMDNHFHLLVYQHNVGALAQLMKSVLVAYTAYYNTKYEHIGPIFSGRYKSSHIYDDQYLLHISRYIHLNPRSWRRYPHSSYKHIHKTTEPEWLQTDRLLSLYPNRKAYLEFVADYEDYKNTLDNVKRDMKNL